MGRWDRQLKDRQQSVQAVRPAGPSRTDTGGRHTIETRAVDGFRASSKPARFAIARRHTHGQGFLSRLAAVSKGLVFWESEDSVTGTFLSWLSNEGGGGMAGWTGLAGTTDCYVQESSWGCGLACIAMVLNRHGHGHPTTRAVAAATRQHRGGYNPPTEERAGFQRVIPRSPALAVPLIRALAKRRAAIEPRDNPLADGTPQQILEFANEGEDPGIGAYNLIATLRRQYNINTSRYVDLPGDALGPLQAVMAGASMAHPAILCLETPAHHVLCEGPVPAQANRYVIVDPADGIRYNDGRLTTGARLRFNGTKYSSVIEEAIVT